MKKLQILDFQVFYMMKLTAVFFVFLLISQFVVASPETTQQQIQQSVQQLMKINGHLLSMADEIDIDQLLKEKMTVLDALMIQLRFSSVSSLPVLNIRKKIEFLESRIEVNKKRGNDLAAQRDQIKLQKYKTDQKIWTYLRFLIESSKNYQAIGYIEKESRRLLKESVAIESKHVLSDIKSEGKVYSELKKNYQDFLQASNSYQDILTYVSINPRKIASVHWFQEFSLLSAISYVNHFDFVLPINYKLAPFNIDMGGVVLSFIIIFLVYFSYPFLFRCTSWCIENYLLDQESERQELIYHQLRKPIRTLLIFFGINLATYAFFYKTDYRASLDGISFIIYSLLVIWLLFKIIDSFVLIRIDKISNTNKQLRKGLFNLGVQSVKGAIIIIVLAIGLSHFGISLTAIMSTLGVGGLAFALAAKDTLSNLFGGITILFDDVFRMGDWVKIGDVEGTVAEIGLRSTTIRTFDNALITIPNSQVSVSSVMNWNRRAVGRRIKMYIGVTYECNMDDLRQGLEDIRSMLRSHPDIANPKQKHDIKRRRFKFTSEEDTHGIKTTQLVFMDRYSDFSIDILIYCFARTVNWAQWLAVKEDVLFKIAEILQKNNLEFAYPTQVRIYRSDKKHQTAVAPFVDSPDDQT